MDERLDWLFENGMSGLSVEQHNGAVVISAYIAGGYDECDVNRGFYLTQDQAIELRDWLNAHLPFTLHLEGDEQPAPYSAERLTPSQVAEQAKQWFATQDDMEAKHG